MRQYLIRCQMSCADTNCSRPRGPEEERVPRDGLITGSALTRWGPAWGLKDTRETGPSQERPECESRYVDLYSHGGCQGITQ